MGEISNSVLEDMQQWRKKISMTKNAVEYSSKKGEEKLAAYIKYLEGEREKLYNIITDGYDTIVQLNNELARIQLARDHESFICSISHPTGNLP
jgi:hypothetical protein